MGVRRDRYFSIMSTTLTPAGATPAAEYDAVQRRRRGRRRVIGAAVSLLVLAGIGFGLGFWRYAASYAPLQPGNFSGLYRTAANAHFHEFSTDLGDEMYVSGPPGATVDLIVALENDGDHPVTVQRFERLDGVADVRWSKYVTRPGGNAFGEPLPLQALPAHLAAHQTIRLVMTLRRPHCGPDGGWGSTNAVTLYWEALGVHHAFDMPLGIDDPTFVPCPQYVHIKPVHHARR